MMFGRTDDSGETKTFIHPPSSVIRDPNSVNAGDAVLDPSVALDPMDVEMLGLRLLLASRVQGCDVA